MQPAARALNPPKLFILPKTWAESASILVSEAHKGTKTPANPPVRWLPRGLKRVGIPRKDYRFLEFYRSARHATGHLAKNRCFAALADRLSLKLDHRGSRVRDSEVLEGASQRRSTGQSRAGQSRPPCWPLPFPGCGHIGEIVPASIARPPDSFTTVKHNR